MFERLSLRIRIFLFFAFLALGGGALMGLGLWLGFSRYDPEAPGPAFIIAGLVGGLGLLGLSAWIWLMFDENVAKPILKLAGGLRTHIHAAGASEIDDAAARYLGDLGPAARAAASSLAQSKDAVDDAVAQRAGSFQAEASSLRDLLAGVPAAIMMCSADHRVIFYNGEAAQLLDGAPPHLGRSVFEAIRAEPVRAAYHRLRGAGDTEFVCATLGNDHTLHIRMRRAAENVGAGYALVMRPLGRMSRTSERWPTTDFDAQHLVEITRSGLSDRQEAIEAGAADIRLTGDPLQLAALLTHLFERLSAEGGKAFTLMIAEGDPATVTLGWAGVALDDVALAGWLEDDIDPGVAYVSGRSVLDLHRTEIEKVAPKGGRNALRLTIPCAQDIEPAGPSLRAVFDFAVAQSLPDTTDRLRDRVFVVFDSETTGLETETDEIVQLAAVRMVNGRIVTDETFEALVNPERKIPTSSTKVHGISDKMVQGAQTIDIVGRRFHHFAQDAVLVAHNAPFDMAFLSRHETRIGRRFNHPVLDTVLLSAILFGQSDEHSLDALTDRLGITIPESLRHTAMGDARGTAQALESMIPMLEAQGLETLSDVIAAARAHGRLLKDLN